MEEIILLKSGGFKSTDNRGIVKRAVRTNSSYDESHKQPRPSFILQVKGWHSSPQRGKGERDLSCLITIPFIDTLWG